MNGPAASSDPKSASSLLTESDYESNKIFAGGLSRTTTTEQLGSYFRQFGEVTDIEIVPDRNTGRSRGFGFVTFASRDAVKTVLSKEHKVDGVPIEVKLAVKREKSKVLAPKYDETKRIFVGGVAERITESYFRDYFARYGPVSSYNYLIDKRTNRPRGYGFVIYENTEDAQKSVGQHPSLGPNCEAKFASAKSDEKDSEELQNFDYAAYYYAQANLIYSQYLSQMYNGYSGQGEAPLPYTAETTDPVENTPDDADRRHRNGRRGGSGSRDRSDKGHDRETREKRELERCRDRDRHRNRDRDYDYRMPPRVREREASRERERRDFTDPRDDRRRSRRSRSRSRDRRRPARRSHSGSRRFKY